MAGRLAEQYPNTNKDITADVRPIMENTGLYYMKPCFWRRSARLDWCC